MSRSSMSTKSQLRRRVVRLALIVALTAPAGLVLADNGPDEIPRDTSASVPELPAYPFAIGVQSNNKGKAQSSRQAVARIFGFGRPIGNSSNSTHAPQALPGMSAAPMQLPSMTQSLPAVDVRSAQAMIGHPQMSEVRSGATAPNTLPAPSKLSQLPSTPKALGSVRDQLDKAVVVAGAAKKMGPIEHSLSDNDPSSEMANSGDMVNNLVNSLVPSEPSYEDPAESTPQFSDSINIQVAEKSEESSVNMSLSDRDEPAEETLASSPAEKDAPQIMSFSDKETEKAIAKVEPTSKPTYDQVVAQQDLPALKSTSSSFENTVQHAVSSRRELPNATSPKNEVRAPELQPAARQPLVPMLASASGRSRVSSEPRALQPVPTNYAVTTADGPAASQIPMEQPALSVPTFKQPATTQSAPVQPSPTQQAQSKEIRVIAKDSVSLQSSENIQAVSVEQGDICQIIQNGPKSYSVIGLRDGETRIAIISESNGQRNVQVQKVVVSSSKNSTTKDNATLAAEISQTVTQLYPRQRVRISTRGSQLVISGTVDSEDTAKKIVSLVRKTTLTPVVDELKTK
ncbi:MAG: pilus assembly protein N-terminal domain-containing protein [Pirellulales bacterium]